MNTSPFVARVSLWRTGLLASLSAGFVALGIWLTTQNDLSAMVAGWVGIAVFGGFALIALRQLFRTDPVIEIDQRGILWRRWSDSWIPWAAIDRVTVRAMRSQDFLCIWLRDPGNYPSARLLGRLAGFNRTLGFGDIAMNTAGTDRQLPDLIAAISVHLPVERV